MNWVVEQHPFMEIINPYCALIAPAACTCDTPLESSPITSIGIEYCVFFF